MEYILTNSENFKQFLSNNSETIFEYCQTISKLGTFGTQVEIYALAYFIHIPLNLCVQYGWVGFNMEMAPVQPQTNIKVQSHLFQFAIAITT